MTVAQRILDEIVRRIVEVAQPDRIILFGSVARGQIRRTVMGPAGGPILSFLIGNA
jgi:hypothetical protein